MRKFLFAATLIAAPCAVSAQWIVSMEAGVHRDRLPQPERVLSTGQSTYMMSSPGEAPVFSMRATHWSNHLGTEFRMALAQNRSWSGGTTVPVPEFAKRTVFTNAAVLWSPLQPASRAHLYIGAGPAVVFHSGSGESTLSRTTDLGVMATTGASWAILDRVRIGLTVADFRFNSTFKNEGTNAQLPETYQSGSHARSEWLVMPMVSLRF